MKYYAVTEDPNELFHYGRLGMKWGQHIFGDKPKSPGYKKALGKLRASTKSVKSAVHKSATQHAMNRQKRQQNKYNQAVKKAQRNNELVENLYKLDKVRVNERGLDRDYYGAAKIARIRDKQNRKMDRINNKRMIKQLKAEVKNNKNELKMDKIAQKARQGKLKYGKLSDDQIQRLTNRLAMERNARQLGSAEKTWRQQKKEAFRQGKLQGITRGTAASMEEIARAGTIYGISKFMNRRKLKAAAKQEGKEERIKNRERNKKSHGDIKREFENEVYEAKVRDGKVWGTKRDAKALKKIEADNREKQRVQNMQDRFTNESDEAWQKYLTDNGYRNEKEAQKAFSKDLDNKLVDAMKRGDSAEADRLAKLRNKVDRKVLGGGKEARSEFRRNAMLKSTKTTTKEKETALAEYNKYQREKQRADRVNAINKSTLENYYKALSAWSSNPNRSNNPPEKPTVRNKMLMATPTVHNISPRSIEILQNMNVPVFSGGGGKKKNS